MHLKYLAITLHIDLLQIFSRKKYFLVVLLFNKLNSELMRREPATIFDPILELELELERYISVCITFLKCNLISHMLKVNYPDADLFRAVGKGKKTICDCCTIKWGDFDRFFTFFMNNFFFFPPKTSKFQT